ncbi:uncharacterized protein FTJAE_10073 [Fusarium tjaetaba]|uniref:Uncharacterized protein n=1 Tax=Fusarium tjaetaba TaxID=1567544 RepID=A0A8H5R4D6_9HYPO|nr:uncharacterized protein FTJAE_10073 [Fusarium tjaetaba]KAF5625176.1 hypothetical protein FTJAE_10073 [Fusarium tjaetaba]
MDANKVITEFIYFHLPEEVKPESIQDPKGQRILNLFNEAKLQDGYNWSAWGRTEEDRNALVWVIAIVKLRTILTPTLSSVGGINATPIVDLTTMPFVAGLSVDDDAGVREVLSTMREAVLNKLPKELAPSYWVMSTWDTRPVVPHRESPTAQSILSVLVVGWQSTQQHYDVWKFQDFRSKYIGPVKAKMLSYPEGLVCFTEAFLAPAELALKITRLRKWNCGAGNGIGLEIVKKLLNSPTVSHVVAVDLKAEKLELIQGDYPQKLHIVVGDVSQENTNIQAVETAIRHGGRLTTLILNAATFRPLGAFPTLSLESWKHAFNINFFSIIHMLQVAWHHLQESSGSVIVTSSRAVLNYLCRCIPLEDSRISSMAITPGAVDTEMQTGLREEGTASPELQKFLDALKAEGRLLKPEEPAAAFAKLVETGIPKDLNGQTVYWEDIL